MAVIRPRIATDPAAIAQIGYDYLRSKIPGWEPADGDLLTWALDAHARMVAEERDVADDVWIEQVFRPVAEQIHGIPPLLASPAEVQATVTLRDKAGYTVPGGMEVLVKTAGDDGVTFATVAPETIVPGEPVGDGPATVTVTLRAVAGREGTAGNGLTSANEAVPIRSFDYIESVELVGESAGGRDAETDADYLARAVDELALTSPIPVLAPDHAALARRVPAVYRALAINLTQQVDETIEITGSAGTAAGTLTDRASGRTVTLTAAMTASSLARAFNDLTPATGGRYVASATGGPLGTAPIVLTLRGREAYGPWQLGVTAQSITFTETQQGGDAADVPRAVAVIPVDVDGQPLGTGARADVKALLEGMREANWITSVLDPTYSTIDVTYSGTTWPDQDPVAVREAVDAALATYLSPATWGMPPTGEEPAWIDEPVVRYLEVAQKINEVPGFRHLDELRIGLNGGALSTANITMPGPGALPRAGTITGTMTEG